MLSQSRLKEILNYDPWTGNFYRGGELVGCNCNGYTQIYIDGRDYLAHRLAWLYMYGYFPENSLDHINRIRNDNRILNLREVSHSCNCRNAKGYASSGVKGVSEKGGNWVAHISIDGRTINLGTFSTLLAAAKARNEAEEKYGFVTCDHLSEAKVFISINPNDGGERVKRTYRSKSGVPGVCWHKGAGKWLAKSNGNYLGLYETIQAAEAACISS